MGNLEHVNNMSFHDVFREVVNLTGRVGTLTYGIGAHLFNVTAYSRVLSGCKAWLDQLATS